MNRRLLFVLTVSIAFVAFALPARADIITFDENGNLTWSGPYGNLTFLGYQAPDPTLGVSGDVLIYDLSFLGYAVGAGDVRIWEDPEMEHLGDVLRFSDASGNFDPASAGATQFIFYSALGGSDLADVGLPTSLIPNDGGGVVEIGGVFSYGDPTSFQYVGTSDVPEPGTLLLVVSGVAALVGFGWRKRS